LWVVNAIPAYSALKYSELPVNAAINWFCCLMQRDLTLYLFCLGTPQTAQTEITSPVAHLYNHSSISLHLPACPVPYAWNTSLELGEDMEKT